VLSAELTTLAEILEDSGYRTGFFSANALFGYNVSGNDEPWSLGFEQGFDEFFVATGSHSGYLRAEPLNEHALKWIVRRGSRRPFFAYIHYMDPHIPYDPPPEFRELFPDSYEGDVEWDKKMLELWASGESIPEDARQHMISLYDAEIAYADRCVAEMLDSLDGAGLLSDTLVVLTADHGEAFHEHDGIWVHGLGLYEELIRVPLVIVPPNAEVRPEPARNSSVVGLIDLMPTILDFAKVTSRKRPAAMRGLSLTALLEDTSAAAQRTGVAAELRYAFRPEGDPQAFTSRALVTDRLKLIEINRPGEPPRTLLFDLKQDPLEQRSLSGDPSSDEQIELLRTQLDLILGERDRVPGRPLPERVRDRLRALGYL
jgi:arylsulfatase A-like enzyme